jgi:hypothetical protein
MRIFGCYVHHPGEKIDHTAIDQNDKAEFVESASQPDDRVGEPEETLTPDARPK